MKLVHGLAALAAVSGAALAGCATASAPDAVIDDAARARLDATLADFVARGEAAGASALIYEDGREVYFGAFGYADREAEVPMARDTLVQIFSMTKPLTGVTLMSLHEDGAFDLDEPLSKYLPEYADVRVHVGADDAGDPVFAAPDRPITIRDITRHTAGFYNDGAEDEVVGALYHDADPLNLDITLPEFSTRLASVPLFFQPGERWFYGPSVSVQAALVERLTGRPFAEVMRETVLDPLGMDDTDYGVAPEDYGRLSAMYEADDSGALIQVPDERGTFLVKHDHALTPGGWGLASTLDDYMAFARMLLNEGELDGVRVVEPETVRLMATNHLADEVTERIWLPSKGQVGFGIDFAVRTAPPVDAAENYGEVGEFFWDGAASTLFWVDPVNDLAVVFFVQHMPFNGVLHKEFRDAVYGPERPAEDSGN